MASGLIALALWALSPNVLAWNGICTVDLGATFFALVAMYALRTYFRQPDWLCALCAGATLGLALLAKFTLLIFYPIWLDLWLVARWIGRRRVPATQRRATWLHFLFVVFVSVAVINVGYGLQGTGRRLGDFPFRCHALTQLHDERLLNRFSGTWLATLQVPLPEMFVLGLDEQKSFADAGASAYLRGYWHETGLWYFYLYVLAVKLPLGTWAIAGLCLLVGYRWPPFRSSLLEEALLWLPAGAVVVLMSSQTNLKAYGSPRYLLPAFPFFFIGISRVGKVFENGWPLYQRADAVICRPFFVCACITIVALAWNAVSSLRIHPHYLSYFNELAGGPERGWDHLIESNIDWGQDLLFLKRWADEHPEALPLKLACYAGMKPQFAGLDCEPIRERRPANSSLSGPLRQGPQPGWYAVSVNLLCGLPWTEWDEHGGRTYHPREAYAYFRLFTPVAKAGYSIFIYHITLEEANGVRSRLGLATLPP